MVASPVLLFVVAVKYSVQTAAVGKGAAPRPVMFRRTVKNPLERIVKSFCIPPDNAAAKAPFQAAFFKPDEGLATGAPKGSGNLGGSDASAVRRPRSIAAARQ